MAEAAISMAEIKENILKCDRCQQQFDSEDRIPRLLPCQHSFCSNCLDDLWTLGTKLSCPECSQQWDVRGSIAETFPLDFAAMKFVVFIELKAKKGRRLCTDCSEKTTATHHCLDCQVYICEEGLRAHKRFYKQKDHKILSVAEILKLPENYLQQTETCMLHPGSTLDLYCSKPTCMVAVCPSCAMIQHKERDGHEIRDLKDVVTDEKKSISEGLDDLKMQQEKVKDEKSELDRDMMYLSIESKRLESSIERYFEDFLNQVAEQKEALRSSLQTAVGHERDQMNSCLNSFKTMIQSQDDFMDYCKDVVADPKFGRFLREKEDIKHKLHVLSTAPLPSRPERKEVFVDLTSVNDSMKKMAKIGEVVYLDHTALQWRCVIEITDAVEEEELIVTRIYLKYAGELIVPPKPPLIRAIIEDSAGMSTHGTLRYTGEDGDGAVEDAVSTRSDELDSPDASRHHTKTTRHSGVYSNDSGYHNSDANDLGNSYDASYRKREHGSRRNSPRDRNSAERRESPKGRYSPQRRDSPRSGNSNRDRYSPQRRNTPGRRDTPNRRNSPEKRNSPRSEENLSLQARQNAVNRSYVKTGSMGSSDGAPGSGRVSRGRNGNKSENDFRSSSSTSNKADSDKEQYETSELRYLAKASGPHKISFRIGGYSVEDDALVFHSKPQGQRDLDRCLHYMTWVSEEKTELKSLNLPHVSLSEERLNREQCTITSEGRLVKSPSESGRRPGTAEFTNYCGTTATRCLSGEGVYYWEVTCLLRVLAKVAAFGKMIVEIAVAHGDVLDNSYCVWETQRAWSLVVSICSSHKSICLKAVCDSKVLFDKPLMECEADAAMDLHLGVLLDLDRRRLIFLDATTGDVLWAFDDIDTSQSMWPVFGVYNRYHFRAEIGVTSGDNLKLSSQISRVLEDFL